ncbi:MAG: acylphosphatase [Methanosarcinaceae archaeon]|nr:acylphosphatase [Methanosarcinaceae archaeon]MDF1533122.1 acylphosphatase [Methanosarcinaceae archaeon]
MGNRGDLESESYVEIYVSGRVQGVYFRQFTKETALNVGLVGYVQNLPDGRVKAIAKGSHENIERFVKQLRTGPRMANVESLDAKWCELSDQFDDFIIK